MKNYIKQIKITRIIISCLIVITALFLPLNSKTFAYAINATDGSNYAQSLVNDSKNNNNKDSHTNVMDKQEWISKTIQNKDTTGFDDLGSFQSFLDNARNAFHNVFVISLGTIVVLFISKMIGRSIYNIVMDGEKEAEMIPMFFLTSKERSTSKEPIVMKVKGGLFGGGGGGGQLPGQREFTGPRYLTEHPYAQFCKEFVAYLGIAVGIFLFIEIILGVASAFLFSAKQGGGADIFQQHNMFGINNH